MPESFALPSALSVRQRHRESEQGVSFVQSVGPRASPSDVEFQVTETQAVPR